MKRERGPYCPGDCMAYPFSDLLTYYPRDYFWMVLAIFQLFAWLMFMAVQHHLAPAGAKLFSLISLAFLFLSFIYTGKGSLEKSIRIILQLSFLLMVVAFIFYAFHYGIERSYRFEVAAISVNWLTILVAGILIGIRFRRMVGA